MISFFVFLRIYIYIYIYRSSLCCTGFSLQWFLLLQSTGSRHVGFSSCSTQAGSVVVVHKLSCSTACGIFLDQGLNLCLLFWQVDSHHYATREVQWSGFEFFLCHVALGQVSSTLRASVTCKEVIK